jgi:hypothetical protein
VSGGEAGESGWDGVERRSNPVRRLLWARHVRDVMRELRDTGRAGRFRRDPDEGPDEPGADEPPGPGGSP